MNERIRELAEQANGPNPFYGTLKNQMTLLGDDTVEKFAQLIIKECLHIVDDEGAGEGGCIRAMIRIQDEFGVEA